MTDNERVLREQIEELKGKLRRLEARQDAGLPSGPDLVLEEHPFTYEWAGKVYGFDALAVSEALGEGDENADGWSRISKIRELAGMPDDLTQAHVVQVFGAAVDKVHKLGKSLAEVPILPSE